MLKRLLLIVSSLIAAGVAAQELPTTESYAVNFDRGTSRTRTDRRLVAHREPRAV